MSNSAQIVRLQNAHVIYGKGAAATHALRGVSLEARAGEVLMIRGPSGSGKTTLLQLMGALKIPDQGAVSLCGQKTTGLSQSALRKLRLHRVGFVFQFFNLLSSLSAWENVAVSLDLQKIKRPQAEQRARELLDQMGLTDRADYKPNEMSGGQRQRVAIARALAHNPTVILADEPTAALDSESGAFIVKSLQKLAHDQNRIVVIVSHDERLLGQADRTITVEDGLLVDRQLASFPASDSSSEGQIQ
jgi:putative ABC transport system ATP-binding protein